MKSKAKKIKEIIKGSPKESFGTNPSDPWSVKYGIAEDASLAKYLNARGINPKFISKDTKISHAKSAEFLKWKRDHQFEDVQVTETASTTHSPTELRQHALKKSQHVNKVPPRSDVATDGLHKEEVDKKDTVTMDIPLLIRVLELAREDLKSDIDLHRVVEKLIDIRNKGTLTMDDYEFVAKLKEEYSNELDEVTKPKLSALDKWRRASDERQKAHQDFMKHIEPKSHEEKMKAMMDKIQSDLRKEETEHKVGDSVTVNSKFFGKQKGKVTKVDKQSVHVRRDGKKSSEKYPHNAVMKEESEQIDEISHDLAGKYLEKVTKDQLDKHGLQPNMYAKLEPKRQKGVDLALDKLAVKEDIYQDGTAPTQTSFDGANAPDNTEPSTSKIKTGLSKSARIIKSLYKHHGIKEELYDSEKEDKSVATYGKKPKMIQTKPEDNLGDNIPQAAAVLTGGKTLTGQTRDTLEIDPEMKKPTRPDAKQTEKNKDK